VFAALVAATVGAIFLTQHLKVSLPLLLGYPNPVPAAFNPVSGRVCKTPAGRVIDFSKTWISFTLAKSDTVDAYIFNSAGQLVDTVRTGQPIPAQVRSPRFYWGGKQSNGEYAPAGTYYWRFVLEHENRTIELTNKPIRVITTFPHPVVTSVRLTGSSATPGGAGGGAAAAGPPIITPKKQSVTIHFTKADYQEAMVMLWRTDSGKAHLATEWPVAKPTLGVSAWNGWIHGRLAPAGTYLIGLKVLDQACNQATWPIAQPPVTPQPANGVTVRYLVAQPPLEPVPAGSRATVYVDSRLHPYRWSLLAVDSGRAISHGRRPGGAYELHVSLPARTTGLYVLTIRSGQYTARVPLVADATVGAAAGARVLVVLPMLTWQGENPVDDTGGGFPDTLTAGDRVELERPFVQGLPAGFGEQASLLRYLKANNLNFQLTTDVSLGERAGSGLSLAGHSGVLLAGAFKWLPVDLIPKLRAYAQAGGRVLSIGAGSLQAQAPLGHAGGVLTAGPPAPISPDPFGAGHGPVSTTAGELITAQSDPLHIFSPAMALTGFHSFQTINPPNGVAASTAGVAAAAPTIVGFRVGKGRVVQIGLPGFASSLARNIASQQLMGRLWTLLSS
jgi:hypothetical protein